VIVTVEELPAVLTVEEAGKFLRISRSAAFRQAELFRASEGRDGIPNYRIGRALRVPRDELLRRFGLAARG
jgi:hypothetical protein